MNILSILSVGLGTKTCSESSEYNDQFSRYSSSVLCIILLKLSCWVSSLEVKS